MTMKEDVFARGVPQINHIPLVPFHVRTPATLPSNLSNPSKHRTLTKQINPDLLVPDRHFRLRLRNAEVSSLVSRSLQTDVHISGRYVLCYCLVAIGGST